MADTPALLKIPLSAPAHLRPDFERPEYIDAQEIRELCAALNVGTKPIRAGGEKFLTRWPAEKEKPFNVRVKIAQVVRYYKRIVDAAVGMINATPAKLADGSAPVLVKWAEDVDGQGTAFGPFAAQVTRDAANGGYCALLVDHPSLPAGAKLRLDQEDTLGLRPVMVRIPADRILSWLVDVPDWPAIIRQYLDGAITTEAAIAEAKQIVTRQVVIYEPTDVVVDGAFGAVTAKRYRVLRLTSEGVVFVLWERRKVGDEEEHFALIGTGHMLAAGKPQWEIPLALAYGGVKVAPFVAEPALAAVAELNLDHHNITSDRRYLMRLCHAPTLFLAGFDDEYDDDGEKKTVEVGPNSLLKSRNADAKASYVSADPSALNSSQEEKLEIVKQIQAIGMAFVGVDRKTAETARGRELDDAAENANIAVMSEGVKDGLENAWRYMAMHRNVPAPTVELKTTYASPRVDPQIATVLWNAVAVDKLDVHSWVEYIKTGELPDDIAQRVEFQRVKDAQNRADALDDPTDTAADQTDPPARQVAA